MGKTKTPTLSRKFKRAKVNWPWIAPQNIGTEWDTAGMNDRIGRKLGAKGHRAIDEIRTAIILLGSPPCPQMRFDDIPRGSSEWSATSKAIWKRFWLWQDQLFRENLQAREATILFAKGHRIREIEQMVHVSQGHGRGAKLIEIGARAYVSILEMEQKN
jgi:hypothetical protein